MEVAEKNIDVQLVCPGPVVSKISINAFSSQLEKVCIKNASLYLIIGMHIHSLLEPWKKTRLVE